MSSLAAILGDLPRAQPGGDSPPKQLGLLPLMTVSHRIPRMNC